MVTEYDVVFGQRCDAGAIQLEAAPPERPFEPFRELSGRPGTRLPHVALDDAGTSTLDLPRDRRLLLTRDAGWTAAARDLSRSGSAIDVASPGGAWPSRVGIDPDGALLARPDGFVAWRARDARSASAAELSRVVGALLGSAAAVEGEGARGASSRRETRA